MLYRKDIIFHHYGHGLVSVVSCVLILPFYNLVSPV